MAGIEDLMNIRTTGGTANAPPMPPQGMGGPPQGMPPQGMPPQGMGAPPQSMPDQGMGQDPMAGMGMEEEEGLDIEADSAMLAEAVVGRVQGDIGAAIAVLDTAKAMLMQSVNQDGQAPLMANMGRPLMRNNGGPMYRENGGSMSQDDVLREMIMENLQKPEIQQQAMTHALAQQETGGAREAAMARLLKFNSA